MRLTRKYPGLVERFYTMKPDKEFLVPNGGDLKNGMIVLLAQDLLRWPVEGRQESDYTDFTDVLKTNRWCRVNDVRTDGYAVHFVGIYGDKTVARRSYPKDIAWLVKKDPEKDNPLAMAEEPLEKIRAIVKEAFEKNEGLVRQHDYPAGEISALVEETTRKILKVL